MEVSTTQAYDFFNKINEADTFKEIVPYNSSRGSTNSARAGLLKRRKPLDKDALLAVKLDPAVLEAQVTLKKEDETSYEDSSALIANSKTKERSYPSFEEMLSMQQEILLALTPQQLELLMAFVETMRRQRQITQRHLECAFCKNNGTPASWYASHALRDRRRVRCPVCARCGARAAAPPATMRTRPSTAPRTCTQILGAALEFFLVLIKSVRILQ